MEWPISYLHYVPGSSSFIEMMRGAMRAMECAGAKPGENVVISTDTNKLRIAEVLAAGEGTTKTAERFKVSPGRVSQLRRELHDAWQAFHGDPLGNSAMATA